MTRNDLGQDEIPQIHVHIWVMNQSPDFAVPSSHFTGWLILVVIDLTRPYCRTQSFWKGISPAVAEKSFCFPLLFASRNVYFASWELPGPPALPLVFFWPAFYAVSCSRVSEFCSPLSCCCFALRGSREDQCCALLPNCPVNSHGWHWEHWDPQSQFCSVILLNSYSLLLCCLRVGHQSVFFS